MNTKLTFLMAIGSAMLGGFTTFVLVSSFPTASAATSTSGYYVCANKKTSVLKMAPSSNKCAKTEYRYFLVSDVTDSGTTSNTPNTAEITYLSPQFTNCNYGGIGPSFVTDVQYNSYSNLSPLTVSKSGLTVCRMTVNVP